MSNSQTPPGRNSNALVVRLKPSGPHQWARCAGSVYASKTRRRGPSMTRETTISRSASARPLAVAAIALFPPLKLPDVPLETVEALVPELLEAADPVAY